MTKRLSPERIAELRADEWVAPERPWVNFKDEADELLGHIDALEAELAESKAEIARLKELRTRDAAEVVAWLAREAPELFERCKAALEKT